MPAFLYLLLPPEISQDRVQRLAQVIGEDISSDSELGALFAEVRTALIRYATRDWATIAPAVVGDFARVVSELEVGVSLEKRYPTVFAALPCRCGGTEGLIGRCGDCGLGLPCSCGGAEGDDGRCRDCGVAMR